MITNIGAFTKGVVAGAIIGASILVVTNPIKERDRRMICKKTSRMFTRIGNFADNLIDTMK